METTMEPRCYTIARGPLQGVCIWDLPGAGTSNFPAADYIKCMGLRYFTGLVIVNAVRFEEIDLALHYEACNWELPSYLVRSKADSDIQNNEEDNGIDAQQTLEDLQKYVCQEASRNMNYPVQDSSRIFVVTGKTRSSYQDVLKPEMERLLHAIERDVKKVTPSGS
eukprot:TRINITY_DN14883_c0_g1_i1.p1 TRINITY_DN14883_c0_g1~~TRINITY_DN14883_c0_g1_i1.p1  ORF type:complete len:192 (+),score=45.61 TRINITY_DN14883_c0_g1_i1:81-578(+)